MKRGTKAVSTVITIFLVLISLIFGATISYMWVMANFYNIPENTTLLSVESVSFPPNDFTYFNVTILNPSYSTGDVNVTAFRITVEDKDEVYTVDTAQPGLPFLMTIGTKQSFKCIDNWSNLACETIRVEPVAEIASVKSFPYATPWVRLTLLPVLNVSESVKSFNMTVENPPDSTANLTISRIEVAGSTVLTNPSLSIVDVLQPGNNQTFICYWDWEYEMGQEVTITVVTVEGFEVNYTTSVLPGAYLYIEEIVFDYTNTTRFNMTLVSLDSTATVFLDSVNITLPDNTTITVETLPTLKLLPVPVPANGSLTLTCLWDWNDCRGERVTVNVYTKQGFTVYGRTVATPPATVWTLDAVKFDLHDLQHFSVNVTNTLVSLQEINITKIEFNQNLTTTDSTVIAPGNQATIECGFNWTSFVGDNATVTVYATHGLNETANSYNLQLPDMKIENVSFSTFSPGNPYLNVTIMSSQFAKHDMNITQVFVTVDNATYSVDGTITSPKIGPAGFILSAGDEITFVCPWNWTPYVGEDVTVTVETAEGFQISTGIKVD